jgi:nucleotide-binding universal stress UspA family protein
MYRRILIPTDGSACSAQAVSQGTSLAKAMGAKVTFLYVLDARAPTLRVEPYDYVFYGETLLKDMRNYGNDVLKRSCQEASKAGVEADSKLVELEHPVEAIVAASKQCDLVVMGSHGRSGVRRLLLGSVTEGVIRRSNKPVLVVHCVPRPEERPESEPAKEVTHG